MNAWITAFRLRTLPLAFAGWLIGTSIAANAFAISWPIAILTLVTAFLLQILSNLANDYGDAVSGVDSEKREGPDRMVQSGRISKRSMGKAVVIFSLLSLMSGGLLLYLAFPGDFVSALVFLIIGIIGIVAAIKYTVGKNPYGYAGFGDAFVFIFFGIVLVFGAYYLQVQSLDLIVLLPAASIGFLSIGVLNVNNIRDIESDQVSGKYSIPVRIGRKNAVIYHFILLFGAMAFSVIFSLLNLTSWIQLVFLLVVFLLVKNIKAVARKSLKELDPYLKQMAIATLLFSILFSLGLGLSSIF